ncbi:hypothetical protein OC842_007010 [Tilletia horrida]|uniref:Uncharacterized protein n=1 Tax=Tilletia horrida TaxID=155126 RepID=A0AAN6G671_9BASI|nr:hypothetical protein OC842_007010 [Tilletia horrida]
MNTTPENLYHALVAEPTSCEGVDENSDERIHLTLEDGLGYRCSFVKRADESLDSLITAYQVYSGLARTSINLSNKGLLLDPNALLLVQHIFNGDKLEVVINPSAAFNLRDPLLISKLLSLSPINDLGFPHDDPYGPPTQPSERQVTVILNDVWPGMAPLAITTRSLREHDANHIVQVIHEGLLGNTRLLSITTSPMATPDALFIMAEVARKEQPLSTSISSIAADVELEQVITLDIIPTDDQGKDTSDKMTLLAGQHTLVGDVKSWINERLPSLGQPLLFHEQSVLHDENDLSDKGFWPGHTYTLRLLRAKQPAWLHPPRLNHSPVPHRVPLMIRFPNLAAKGVIVRREDTLLHALRMAGYETPETLRPVFEGHRFALTDTAAHIYRVSKGHGVDIEQEQVGGSGPRLRSSRDGDGQPISTDQPPILVSQRFNRLTQETVLGCIKGQYKPAPSPRRRHPAAASRRFGAMGNRSKSA